MRIGTDFEWIDGEEDHGSPDLHFDPWLEPSSPALIALSDAVFRDLEDRAQRTRNVRGDAKRRRQSAVAVIVANMALLVAFHDAECRMAISLMHSGGGPKAGIVPPKLIGATVKALHQAGRIDMVLGERGHPTRWQPLRRTTIAPTASLRAELSSANLQGPGASFVRQVPGRESIVLREPRSGKPGSPPKNRPFEETALTATLRHEMETINQHLAGADIRLDGRPHPQRHLRRIFQVPPETDAPLFERLGRLYGGFWMNLPKSDRHRITISGEEIDDLDYQAMFPFLAYTRLGLQLPAGDPYGGIVGLPRDAAKLGLVILLGAYEIPKRAPSKLARELPSGWTMRRVTKALGERHPALRELFGNNGVGLDLTFTESKILISVLLALARRGVTALPMHDGIMVSSSNKETARRELVAASERHLGVPLTVVDKPVRRPSGKISGLQ